MWKNKFIELMYPTLSKDLRIEEAMKLKYDNMPDRLYKYRTINSNTISSLQADSVWMSSLEDFNDTYEGEVYFEASAMVKPNGFLEAYENYPEKNDQIEGIKHELVGLSTEEQFKRVMLLDEEIGKNEEVIHHLWQVLKGNIEKLNDEAIESFSNRMKNGMFACCFCESHLEPKMWAHYADENKGICIEYDFRVLGEEDVLTRITYPVIYTDEKIDITEYLIDTKKNNILVGNYIATTKGTDWDHEKEWRILAPLGEGDGFLRPVPKPISITLGTKVSNDNELLIRDICRKRDIKLYRLLKSRKNYYFDRELLDN